MQSGTLDMSQACCYILCMCIDGHKGLPRIPGLYPCGPHRRRDRHLLSAPAGFSPAAQVRAEKWHLFPAPPGSNSPPPARNNDVTMLQPSSRCHSAMVARRWQLSCVVLCCAAGSPPDCAAGSPPDACESRRWLRCGCAAGCESRQWLRTATTAALSSVAARRW